MSVIKFVTSRRPIFCADSFATRSFIRLLLFYSQTYVDLYICTRVRDDRRGTRWKNASTRTCARRARTPLHEFSRTRQWGRGVVTLLRPASSMTRWGPAEVTADCRLLQRGVGIVAAMVRSARRGLQPAARLVFVSRPAITF